MTIDRMLPGIDGIAIIRRLREEGIVTPALIVSALGEIDDRVRGLRAGGDDYLVKPFDFTELLARVEALARRSDRVVKEMVLRVGDLELDLVSRAVSRCGRRIDLLPREFQVLEYLVRNQGQVVPRAILPQQVWDFHFDPMTNIIDVYVGRVRRKVDALRKPIRSGIKSALSNCFGGTEGRPSLAYSLEKLRLSSFRTSRTSSRIFRKGWLAVTRDSGDK
jgi:two-component system, OmpR family, response regulator